MHPFPDSQSAPQTSEQFAEYLRKRVQEAITASVHHASLSQQYLSISQRFSALAEQASVGNAAISYKALEQLEREANSGIFAAPLTTMQSTAAAFSSDLPAKALIPDSDAGIKLPELQSAAIEEQLIHFSPARRPSAETDDAASVWITPSVAIAPPLAITSPRQEAPWPEEAVPPENAPLVELAPTHEHASDPDHALSPENRNHNSEVLSSAADALDQSPETNSTSPGRKNEPPSAAINSTLERTRPVRNQIAEKGRGHAKKSERKQPTPSPKEEPARASGTRRSTAISLVIHGIVLFILALRQLEFFDRAPEQTIPIFTMSDSTESMENLISMEPPAPETGEQLEQPVVEMIEEPESEPIPELMLDPILVAELANVSLPMAEATSVSLPKTPNGTGASSSATTDGAGTGAVNGRSDAGRKVMLKKYGGSAGSESAVGFALEWLAARQRANGSWDFIDVGPCTMQGSVNNPIGGTAYALLPFLAAGQTHKEGTYRKQVQAGLDFLMSIGVAAPAGYDLRGVVNKADDDTDPNYAYYVHGAATLALCEAYGMTKDRKLKAPAEGAVAFLVKSQDPGGGGWRYNPLQGGSTSATTIQVMALKSAEKAGIQIPDATWKGISLYLDSVSVDGNGRYGYEVQKKEYAMSVTSMALLSRMYLGWGRDDGDLRAGMALIDKSASTENYYTNYFATQAMKNWGGAEWERWNGRLRDQLVARQETEGPAKGSWAPRDRADYSKSGGRLLTTCLATLTLEVYYRYQPLLPEITEPGSQEAAAAALPETTVPASSARKE